MKTGLFLNKSWYRNFILIKAILAIYYAFSKSVFSDLRLHFLVIPRSFILYKTYFLRAHIPRSKISINFVEFHLWWFRNLFNIFKHLKMRSQNGNIPLNLFTLLFLPLVILFYYFMKLCFRMPWFNYKIFILFLPFLLYKSITTTQFSFSPFKYFF